MQVSAFVPAVKAALDGEAVRASGLPMSRFTLPSIPAQITVQLVLSVWAETGEDKNPRVYAVAHDPDGVRRGAVEQRWNWPDAEDQRFKFHVFALSLPVLVRKEGIYKIGLYEDLDGTETDHWFPLPVRVKR